MQNDLLEPATRAPVERVDFWNLMAVEKFGCPPGWRWSKIETVGDVFAKVPREQMVTLVVGGVFVERYKSGPRKGQINHKKPAAGSSRTFGVTFKDFDAFCLEWEAKTGRCQDCQGAGQKAVGWSAADGERLAQCDRCKGTGAKP